MYYLFYMWECALNLSEIFVVRKDWIITKNNVYVTNEPQRVGVRHNRMVCDLSVFLFIYMGVSFYITWKYNKYCS